MRPDRSWILRRKDSTGRVTEEFMDGVDDFMKLGTELPMNIDSLGRILCPCGRCKNRVRIDSYSLEKHLYDYGFVEGYLNWKLHGENVRGGEASAFNVADDEVDTRKPYVDMVMDAAGRGNRRARGRGRSSQPVHGDVLAVSPLAAPVSAVAPPTVPLDASGPRDSTTLVTIPPSPKLWTASTHISDSMTSGPTSIDSTEPCVTDRRKVISVEAISNPRQFVPHKVTRDIMSSVLVRMPSPAEKWKDYPTEVKDALFQEFMERYQFASKYDCTMARHVWETTCNDRYQDMLKKARAKALVAANSTNLSDAKGHGPKGMKNEVWDGLVDIWLSLQWQRKSEVARRNRTSMPDAMLQKTGSISLREHKKKMEVERKQVSYRDVYHETHQNKAGAFVSDHSKQFADNLDNAMSKKWGEKSSYPEIDSNVWLEVAGPTKKRRIHSMGHGLELSTDGSSTSATSACATSSSMSAPSLVAIKAAVNAAMTSFVNTQFVPMLEGILSRYTGFQVSNLAPVPPYQGEEPVGQVVKGEDNNNDDDLGLD